MRKAFIPLFLTFGSMALFADVTNDVDILIGDGNYAEALSTLDAEINANTKSRDFGTLNQKAGEVALMMGKKTEARRYFEKARDKGVADAYLQLGRLEYENYEFSKAAQSYSKYSTLKTRAGKPLEANVDADKQRIETARSFLERVENVVILDSLNVDKDTFITNFKLSPSSGKLVYARNLDENPFGEMSDMSPIFVSESGDFMMSAKDDSLLEAHRLLDGSWSVTAVPAMEGISQVTTPFMMADGETLYFAGCGDSSIGEYDIFVSSRNSSTGEYMSPRNMGMPYNSPANDFMMAIDEETGIGWWATDRNASNPDELTVYLFLPNKLRQNYPADDSDIVDKAKITDYKATWGDSDYSPYLQRLDAIQTAVVDEPDFYFYMPDGSLYTHYDDFRTIAGKNAMNRYLQALKQSENVENDLRELRRRYHSGERSDELQQRIESLESSAESDRQRLIDLKNAVIRAENQ